LLVSKYKVSSKEENYNSEESNNSSMIYNYHLEEDNPIYFNLESFLFIFKRFLTCMLLFLFQELDISIKMSLFLGIHLMFYITRLILMRSRIMNYQINEIINEMIYLILVTIKILNRTNENWSNFEVNLFAYLIISSFVIQFVSSMSKSSFSEINLILFLVFIPISYLRGKKIVKSDIPKLNIDSKNLKMQETTSEAFFNIHSIPQENNHAKYVLSLDDQNSNPIAISSKILKA